MKTPRITKLAPAFEAAIGQLAHVSRKNKAQEIQIVKFAVRVTKTNDIAGTAAAIFECAQRMFDTA